MTCTRQCHTCVVDLPGEQFVLSGLENGTHEPLSLCPSDALFPTNKWLLYGRLSRWRLATSTVTACLTR